MLQYIQCDIILLIEKFNLNASIPNLTVGGNVEWWKCWGCWVEYS